MKFIKNAVKNCARTLVYRVDSMSQARSKAFSYGFLSARIPRFLRRLAGKSQLHRFWLRGKMTKRLDLSGRCFAADGRQLPFQIEPRDFPILVPQEFWLALSGMFLIIVIAGFVLSLQPAFTG
jgi:ribosomal protein L44E